MFKDGVLTLIVRLNVEREDADGNPIAVPQVFADEVTGNVMNALKRAVIWGNLSGEIDGLSVGVLSVKEG